MPHNNNHPNPPLFLYEVLLEEYASFDLPLVSESEISAKRAALDAAYSHLPEKERRRTVNTELTKSLINLHEQRSVAAPQGQLPAGTPPAVAEDGGAAKERRETVFAAGEAAVAASVGAGATGAEAAGRRAIYEVVRQELELRRREFEAQVIEGEDETERLQRIDGQMLPLVYKRIRDVQNSVAESKREELAGRFAYLTNNGNKDEAVGDAVKIEGARAALCLSGGGIRSATFNLGILQGLARHGLLEKFDYLSTVSGGGFVGSWLSAWIHRRGLDEVVSKMGSAAPSPTAPDAWPVAFLRTFSNYLSPRVGLLSADTWTLVATFLRNLLLTWLVFLPVIMAALMLPRLWLAFISRQTLPDGWAVPLSLGLGVVTGMVALTYIGLNLPSTGDRNMPRKAFMRFCLFPLVLSSVALVTFWARRGHGVESPMWTWEDFGLFAVILISVPWIITSIVTIRRGKALARAAHAMADAQRAERETADAAERAGAAVDDRGAPPSEQKAYRPAVVAEHRFPVWKWVVPLLLATAAIGVALYLSGWVVHAIATHFFPGPVSVAASELAAGGAGPDRRFYATFAVPVMLLLLVLAGTFISGFTSRWTEDEDQEWWSRIGAWTLIVAVGWVALCALVLYAPQLFVNLYTNLRAMFSPSGSLSSLTPGDYFKVGGGAVSLILTLYGGFSAKTPANEREAAKGGLMSKLLPILTNVAAAVLLVYVIILLALLTNVLLTIAGTSINAAIGGLDLTTTAPAEHAELLARASFRYLVVWTLLLALFGGVLGWLINSNKFSLHYMWRNRIIRAYLGASRPRRRPNLFTDFDTHDNIPFYALRYDHPHAPAWEPDRFREDPPHPVRTKKLLHIANVALNLAGSPRLAWQDRKAESFTVSPLHSGSFWTGYRRTWEYGGRGDRSISLGTAVAISGAFVSPNMGYMMTSPIVRFLMTLFNVRFGWWLGNPGYAGDTGHGDTARIDVRRTYDQKAPRLSVKPIIEEAFGYTNDHSDYVYLSDGGHFENLGLYEMVLRRCRLIVVSDASTDAEYSFQSLAMSIRQIRVDLGVPIELKDFSIVRPSRTMAGKYSAVGKIRYSCVDKKNPDEPDDLYDGILVYLKPSLIGDEPRDVLNYSDDSPSFPQEVITDQWFSEAQFESYRELGSHMINEICDDPERRAYQKKQQQQQPHGAAADPSRTKLDLATFVYNVRRHNRLNFRAFDEQIRFTTFEEQVRELIKRNNLPQEEDRDSFAGRVRDYIRNITG